MYSCLFYIFGENIDIYNKIIKDITNDKYCKKNNIEVCKICMNYFCPNLYQSESLCVWERKPAYWICLKKIIELWFNFTSAHHSCPRTISRKHEATPTFRQSLICVSNGCQSTPLCVPARTNNGRLLGYFKKRNWSQL